MRTKNELYQEALRTVARRRQTARAKAEDARAEAEAAVPGLRRAEEEVRVRGIRCALAGAAGKDRTGVAAMLILLALGASDETICFFFLRTNLCRAAEIEKAMADHAAEIAADPAQRMRWQTSAGVDPETAPFVLRTIRQDYGSAESYLEAEYGLTPARLMRLRRMYLE